MISTIHLLSSLDDGIVVVRGAEPHDREKIVRQRYAIRKRKAQRMTTQEYLQTPETVLPHELAFGVLRVADAPRASHQRVVLELLLAVAPFVRTRLLGEMLPAPIDVILDEDAALVVQPDLVFVSAARRHIISDQINGAPDLVVEVLSPYPRVGQLDERVGWFARYGIRECWLAHLFERKIVVLSLTNRGVADRALFAGNERIRSQVLPDLELTPLQIFGW